MKDSSKSMKIVGESRAVGIGIACRFIAFIKRFESLESSLSCLCLFCFYNLKGFLRFDAGCAWTFQVRKVGPEKRQVLILLVFRPSNDEISS